MFHCQTRFGAYNDRAILRNRIHDHASKLCPSDDETIYQAIGDGSVVVPTDDETVPFSNVTFFEIDLALPLSDIPDKAALQTTLNVITKNYKMYCGGNRMPRQIPDEIRENALSMLKNGKI